jgi:catechol 2,3-dioxygenase-like lactoylglutathione lyase family enzyme
LERILRRICNGTRRDFSLWALDAYKEIAGPVAASDFGTGGIMLEFQVDDVDAEFTRLQHLSDFRIDFIIPPTTMAWGDRSIYFRDPDGNLINLFSAVKDQGTSR